MLQITSCIIHSHSPLALIIGYKAGKHTTVHTVLYVQSYMMTAANQQQPKKAFSSSLAVLQHSPVATDEMFIPSHPSSGSGGVKAESNICVAGHSGGHDGVYIPHIAGAQSKHINHVCECLIATLLALLFIFMAVCKIYNGVGRRGACNI